MALKKPKKSKLPKKPKASASAETMKRYLQKVGDIDKKYKKDLQDYNKEKSSRDSLRKKIANI